MQSHWVARYFRVAEQCLAAGNLTAADLLCRVVLGKDPHQLPAYNFRGIVAAQLGFFDQARLLFETAINGGYNAARGNLALLDNMAGVSPSAKAGGECFILIKPWGQGFWSEVTHVLGGLLLAEITDRIPVVHWGTKSLYGGTDRDDGFRAFFTPVSATALADLAHVPALDIYPHHWTVEKLSSDCPTRLPSEGFTGATAAALDLLGRRERLVVADFHLSVAELAGWLPTSHPLHGKTIEQIFADLAIKYLQPVPTVAQFCDDFYRNRLADAPSVAIHLRGSDKRFEDATIIEANNQALGLLTQIPADTRIFGMTDDAGYSDLLANTYGDRLVMITCERTASSVGTHFTSDENGRVRGIEIMHDTYIGIKADRFIGCGSTNVAAMAAVLRDWPDDRCTIIGESYLTALDLRLYLHLSRQVLSFLGSSDDRP